MKRHVYALYALLALLAAACVFSVWQVQNVQHSQNDALHEIACFIADREQQSPTTSARSKREAAAFWAEALHAAHLSPCD